MTKQERIANIDVDHISVDTVTMLFWWCPRWLARLVISNLERRGKFIRNSDGTYRLDVSKMVEV